jgi:GNAT superfamily N-acetyltransferase
MSEDKKIVSNLKLVKISTAKEKIKWLERFRKSYSGGMQKTSAEIYKDEVCLFFVALSNDIEVGYIRISNYSKYYSHITQEPAWSASDAYVKPKYRKSGILRYMLEEVVAKYSVVSAFIEIERYIENQRYYKSLGFEYVMETPCESLLFVFQANFAEAIDRQPELTAVNDEQFRLAA